MTQNRFKSKVVWAAIAATLLTLFGHIGLYDLIGVSQAAFQALIDAVLGILVAFGVLNNPTNANEF